MRYESAPTPRGNVGVSYESQALADAQARAMGVDRVQADAVLSAQRLRDGHWRAGLLALWREFNAKQDGAEHLQEALAWREAALRITHLIEGNGVLPPAGGLIEGLGPNAPLERDCQHGQLARACDRCADAREISELREANERFGVRQAWWTERMFALEQERDAMRRALHEIAKEWAGAECGEPVHAQEAYAIRLAKRMYALAVEFGA
jgi:hypothetical protein